MPTKILIPSAVLLISVLVSGCDFMDTIKLGNLKLVLTGELEAANLPIHSGFPRKIQTDALPKTDRQDWGGCENSGQNSQLQEYRAAQAEVTGIRLLAATGNRVEKLPVELHTVDLFRLASDISELLTEARIPTGEYKEIQISISKAKLIDRAGKAWPLDIPLGDQDGIRIQLDRNLIIGEETQGLWISLSFCTGANFILENIGKPNQKLEFHPLINRIANISL